MVKKYQLTAILSALVMSYLSRILLLTYKLIPLDLLYYWFPLCNAFEFCLGIGIVQNKWYPKDVKDHPIIRKLSDLSFYVFLFHVIVINALISATYNIIAQGKGPVVYSIYYLGVMGTVLLVSWVAMTIDKKIHQTIMKSDRINNFLTS
jgi:peptidoglycan/LPS O-acetylase OafA/YrhL